MEHKNLSEQDFFDLLQASLSSKLSVVTPVSNLSSSEEMIFLEPLTQTYKLSAFEQIDEEHTYYLLFDHAIYL